MKNIKRIFSIMLAIMMVLSLSTPALAATAKIIPEDKIIQDDINVLQIRNKLNYIKEEFPEANIDVEGYINKAMRQYTLEKQGIMSQTNNYSPTTPIKTYKKIRDDGSIVELNEYIHDIYEIREAQLGTSTSIGSSTIKYTGTKVIVVNLNGMRLCNAWYYVNHTHRPMSGTGSVNGVSDFGSTGFIFVSFGNPRYTQTSGSASEVQFDAFDTGLLGPSVLSGTCALRFNANNFSVTTRWGVA